MVADDEFEQAVADLAAKLGSGPEDLDLSLDDFAARVNSDLVGKYVNIASRAAGFLIKRFEGRVQDSAMNHPLLPVHRKARVAILATGDELRLPGQTLGPGQIIASNTFGIAALARGAGADVIDLGIAADRIEALDEALDTALANEVDVLVRGEGAEVFFDVRMNDAWVWDVYRQARFVKNVRVLTFKDVNVEELPPRDLQMPE